MSNSFSLVSSVLCFFFFIFCSIEASVVPRAKTFKYVNDLRYLNPGEVENGATFRRLEISNDIFALYFYNTTPDSFFLGLGMGHAGALTLLRWVWTASPARPVGENATLVFNRSGNLALVNADGTMAWQTRTSNKGVVDIKLLPNGNLVLLDKKGGFVWQSFHYPTDTLLVGQGLGPGSSSRNKLVNGAYSMILEDKQIGLFYKSPQSSEPILYWYLVDPNHIASPLMNVTFNIASTADGPPYENYLVLLYSDHPNHGRWLFDFVQPKYNSTLSILRLGADGNIHIYTYYEKGVHSAWEETSTVFSRNWHASECLMPEKCGSLGVCDNNECVACPTPNGLMGWSKDCKPSKLPSCNISPANVSYYKIGGVDHFSSTSSQGEGPMKIGQCRKKCSNDCKCMAFFYRVDTSMCLLTKTLNTLRKVTDSSSKDRIAYIKYAK